MSRILEVLRGSFLLQTLAEGIWARFPLFFRMLDSCFHAIPLALGILVYPVETAKSLSIETELCICFLIPLSHTLRGTHFILLNRTWGMGLLSPQTRVPFFVGAVLLRRLFFLGCSRCVRWCASGVLVPLLSQVPFHNGFVLANLSADIFGLLRNDRILARAKSSL